MVCHVHEPPLPGVPRPSIILILVFLLICCVHPNLCMSSGSDKDQFANLTLSSTFDQLPGYLYLFNLSLSSCGGWERVWGGLGSYMKTYHAQFNLSDNGFFLALDSMPIDGRSFSIVFTMSIYQPSSQAKAISSLLFTLQPVLVPEFYEFDMFSLFDMQWSPIFKPSSTTSANVSGSLVSTNIYQRYPAGFWVQIGIELPGMYSVWIDYDHVEDRVWVYVNQGEGTSKPANAVASMVLATPHACNIPEKASFGFFSSVGQLIDLHTWNSSINNTHNSTIEDTGNSTTNWLPPWCFGPFYPPRDNSHQKGKLASILSSVLGSVAATVITAALVYFYFNSKYMKWKKEQDKLTKTMQQLPGVPTHVDFADIRKATKNFHEALKLGKGGFGSVYRCTLPAAASRTGLAMEVAVKKFMREVEDQRYDDFLAEVSIINRLRHKNIVPLVGWSYNKGEPLLIYEYMTNGSLDQHLFRRGGTSTTIRRHGQQQQPRDIDDVISQWDTRYGIARDIATGLHYVHNEHEPMVLHRDIKASNIMLDSNFRARLGDFGIACTVAGDRTSATGVAGTFGYMAPEFVITFKATRQTDIYAFGVLILEIITGNRNNQFGAPADDDGHITIWVRRLHRGGKLLEAVDDSILLQECHNQLDKQVDEAKRLLLLGLACTNLNPASRPSMADVLQVINKVAPPPDVCHDDRPIMLFGLTEELSSLNSDDDGIVGNTQEGSSSSRMVELVQVSHDHE